MTTIYRLIFFILIAVGIPSVSFAAPTATQVSTQVVGSSFVARYSVAQPPADSTPVYLWVGEYLKVPNTWISKSKTVITLPKAAAQYPKTFNAEIDFGSYGIIDGVTYAYVLVDKNAGILNGTNILDLNTAESLTVRCFTTTGSVLCSNTPKNPTFNQSSFVATPVAQAPDPNTSGKYVADISVKSNVALVADVPAKIRIYTYSGTVSVFVKEEFFTIPTTGTVSINVAGLSPGDYIGTIYTGTTQISGEAKWTLAATGGLPSPQGPQPQSQQGIPFVPTFTNPTTPGQSYYVGGITIFFNPKDQKVEETSATLKATVSVQIDMPVDFQVLTGSSPTKIDKVYTPVLQPVSMNAGLVPGEVRTFSIPFTGLTKGTTYYFIVKNNATGTQSPVWNFTTKGGTLPIPESEMTIFDAGSGPYSDPGGFTPLVDTISDKGIVPKCGRTQNDAGTIPVGETEMCDKDDFMKLIANIVQYALIIIAPIIAIVAMYAGAMILWLNYDRDPSDEVQKEKKKYFGMLGRAVVGIGIVMLAWILVATVLRELGVKPEYVLLDLFSKK